MDAVLMDGLGSAHAVLCWELLLETALLLHMMFCTCGLLFAGFYSYCIYLWVLHMLDMLEAALLLLILGTLADVVCYTGCCWCLYSF